MNRTWGNQLLIPFAVLFLSSAAGAADLFSELKRFDPKDHAKRVGLETEMEGLPIDDVAGIIHEVSGGKVVEEFATYEYRDSGTGQSAMITDRKLKLRKSLLGNVLLKPEDNARSLADLLAQTSKSTLIEIVTAPLSLPQVEIFQESLERIEAAGGRGTSPELAVAFQVNVEMGKGERHNIHAHHVVSILRNYLCPWNRDEIASRLNVPEIRRKYLGSPMSGFTERICSPDYRPGWDQLYMDSMYRSSLEHLGDPEAWTMSDDEARARLRAAVESRGFEILLPVVKWNFLRYSSLMMFMRPEEWLSKELMASTWFHDYPILEFREPNSSFEAKETVDWVLSFVAASERYPVFSAKSLAAERRKAKRDCQNVLKLPVGKKRASKAPVSPRVARR